MRFAGNPRIFSINIGGVKGEPKEMVLSGYLQTGLGLQGDVHAGVGKRQISLLSIEEIEKSEAPGKDLRPGIFAENITTENLDLGSLEIGDHLHMADEAVLEVTQIGKTCHSRCSIARSLGHCIMPRQGVFAVVVRGGALHVRDPIQVVKSRPVSRLRSKLFRIPVRSFLLR